MTLTIIPLFLVLCAVIANTNCERTKECTNCKTSYYVRTKRAKYSYPPRIFYRPPPMVEPVEGLFSYTPPPNYMMDDKNQYPPNRPLKVSKRLTERVSQEDINNIVKHTSQKVFDKLIEMAEKEKYVDKYTKPEKNERDERTRTGSDIYKADIQEIKADNFNPYLYGDRSHNYVKEPTQSNIVYRKYPPNKEFISQQSKYQYMNPNINYVRDSSKVMNANSESQMPNKFVIRVYPQDTDYEMNVNSNYFNDMTTKTIYTNSPNIETSPIKTTYTHLENSPSDIQNAGFDVNDMKEYFNWVQNFNEMISKNGHMFTDSSMLKEEELPKPMNLREEEQAISYTNNVPSVVQADSSYEVKNFGDLPLMNYQNSKLHTVSSYNVPHYTVSNIIWFNT